MSSPPLPRITSAPAPTADEVVALEADHPVVSAPGGDHVVAVRASELVGPSRADDRRLAPRAGAERRVAAERLAHCHGLLGQLIGVGAGDLAAAFGPRDLADERGELVAGLGGVLLRSVELQQQAAIEGGRQVEVPDPRDQVGDRGTV